MLLMLRKYRDSDGEAAAPCPVLLTIHISPHQAVRALHFGGTAGMQCSEGRRP